MDNALLIAIFAGLGGMFGWGAADFFAKKTIDAAGPIKSLVWAHVFGTITLIIAALGQHFVLKQPVELPNSGTAFLGLLFFGVLQMLVYWLVYRGFEKGQLSVLSPIFASYAGIVALASVTLFGEPITAALVAALFMLFSGIILVNVDTSGLRSKQLNVVPGLKEVGASAVLAAIWTLGWDQFVEGKDSLSYTLFMYAFMSLAAWCLARLMKQTVLGVPRGLWKFLALSGLGEAVAYLSITWGYSATNYTGVVALISGAFTVPTVILAYLFLHERISRIQVTAIGLIIIGILVVSLAG